MGKSIKQAQEEISVKEFKEWVAYQNLYPDVLERIEITLATLCALFANAHKAKGSRKLTERDFLVKLGEGTIKKTPKQLENIFKTFVKNHNKKFNGKK